MFVKIVEAQEQDESHAEEEHRLLEQLTKIDRRLRSRTDVNTDNNEWRLWGQHKQIEKFGHLKWNLKDKEHMHIYNTNMEYFSEIHTEENDEDSLFDPHNNIMIIHKQARPRLVNKNDMEKNRRGANDESEKQNRSHNSQSQKQFTLNDKMVKEMSYAYKKETQPMNRAALPPKNNKLSSSKGSLLPPKSQTKNSSANLRRSSTTPQNLLNKVLSRDQYKQKQMIVEEKQSEDDPNEFKFHTFEVFLDNSNEVPSKSNSKCGKYKNQEQDKVSLQCTFKPTILKRSAQLAKNTKNVVERLSTSAIPSREQKKPYQHPNKQSINKNRLQELSQPRRLKTQVQQKEEDVPSFRPSLSKKSLEHMSNCTYGVATRNSLWQKQRQEKIERMRLEEEKEKQKRQNCTHSPSLCLYRGQNAPNLSRFGRQGMQNYFERLSINTKSGLRLKPTDHIKDNRHSQSNMLKEGYSSKGIKKQKYQDAVKQLHNRIMGLKI